MKKLTLKVIALTIILAFISSSAFAQWQVDKSYGFKINIPSNWSKQSHMDGKDKIFDYSSPDQNAGVQLRVFEATPQVTVDILCQAYESSYLPAGIRKESLVDYTSVNGIPGKQGLYILNYNNTEVTIATFYTVQNNIGYVLSAIIPTGMVEKKGTELKQITQSFIIDGFEKTANIVQEEKKPAGLSGLLGRSTENNNLSVENISSGISSSAKSSSSNSIKLDGDENNYDIANDKVKTYAGIDPFDVSAQRAFWVDVKLSDGKWKELPFKSTLMIKSMSSNLMSYYVNASGGRNSTMYSPHVIQFKESTKQVEQNSYNFIYNGYNDYVDDADDISSLTHGFNWTCGRQGMILFSEDGCASWITQHTPNEENLKSISFANEFIGCAVGENGTILITDNGGKLWTKAVSPVSGHLKCVEMVTAQTGYILVERTNGLKGYVLKTINAGQTWSITQYNSAFQNPVPMFGMDFIDANTGYICGVLGVVYKTTDGGDSWKYIKSTRELCDSNNLNAIYMPSKKEVWACGSKGILLYSDDGGEDWEKIDIGVPYHFTALEFNGPYLGWVSTASNVYQYDDEKYDSFQGAFYQVFKERK